MLAFAVASPDRLKLVGYAGGRLDGPEILFIHGFNQCHLSWARQTSDPALAGAFRMVAFDLRGHGSSGKPTGREHYDADRLWGDDVAAVIAAAGLKRPVLVGWSYAGRVISDYLCTHGSKGISGINFVAAVTKTDPTMMGPASFASADILSEDLAKNIVATRAFLRACFELQPERDAFETMLAFNMVVPASVRARVRGRPPSPGDALAGIDVPVLVTHGTKDQLVLDSMGKFTASTVKGAKLSLYENIGHAPFWEDAARFNRELAEFVRSAWN
jgi:pimeloyl-ACP methyl ester carboxylesterase